MEFFLFPLATVIIFVDCCTFDVYSYMMLMHVTVVEIVEAHFVLFLVLLS